MINIEIDVHKKRCIATIKSDSRQILQQVTFDNNADGIARFISDVKQQHGSSVRSVKWKNMVRELRLKALLYDRFMSM